MLRLNPKWQTNNKFGAFSLFCQNLNGTAHHIHNILGNGHAKPCTLDPADRGSTFPLKGRKDLLYNAVKFTPAGGTVSVRIRQYPGTVKGSELYEIRVKDNGIGMSQEFVH